MMFEEVTRQACAMRSNQLDDLTLKTLLWELENQLAVEIRGEGPDTPSVLDTDLLIPPPFQNIYWTYLVAMIDLAAKDLDAYKHSYALFCEARDTYARWYNRTGGKF
jgi:hypothetical protein